ncbi:MAG: asparaginase [Candidatus Aenigmarchaeota archaeon]|nr:asparaginase [Candidatus Aenigmarchaeota archaeon]
MSKYANKGYGLHVVTTGGTMDFESSPSYEMEKSVVDSLVPRKQSIIPRFLTERVKIPKNEISFSRACMKDSRDINDEDRSKILDGIIRSPYGKVLVVHGIVEMDKTRDYLANHKDKLKGKTVGIVGSRMPLSSYRSDGGFQLGHSIGAMQKSKSGIYMFHPDETRDKTKKLFENTVFLITGGTVDSNFNEHEDTATPCEHSIIPTYFRETLGVAPEEPNFVFKEICMKDSRQLSEENIRLLLQESQNQRFNDQVISAGTYALSDLAVRYKTMVDKGELSPDLKYNFFGSMFPEDVYLNDGWFNMGYVLGRKESLKNGVHVSMHGWTTPPENVMKQLQEARFKLYDKSLR